MSAQEPSTDSRQSTEIIRYQPPTVTPIAEDEILKVFQVTGAGVTGWWTM